MAIEIQTLHEVWRITEFKDGAVFKTEFVERRWVPVNAKMSAHPDNAPDLIWVSVSNGYAMENKTFRTLIVADPT